METILIVEDDAHVANFLKEGLKQEGYFVENCSLGFAAVQKSILSPSNILILDRMLPDIDGVSVCRKLRKQGYTGYIMMLTAKDKISDRIDGLKSGADDYLCKPFDFDELIARLDAFCRRKFMLSTNEENRIFEKGNLKIDLNTRTVICDNKTVELTKREFELLHFLALNEGKVLERAEIVSGVWGYNFETETKIVEVYIRYLRQKFAQKGCQFEIESVRGVGYRLKIQ